MRKLVMFLCTLLACVQLMAQNRTVTGKVTDDKGAPIPNATVVAKGTRQGTTTNNQGVFSFSVASTAKTLTITSLGFADQDVTIGPNNTVAVSLVAATGQLDEVVVVGYGAAKKRSDVTGSVTVVAAERVQDKPSANMMDALQGKVAGLQIYTSSGEPSAGSSIRINGVGSLGSSSTPLFIMDGIPIDPNLIVSLNPEDFESISVLKDASATSIYGARAANGVILFTSKRGSVNTSRISLQTQYGVSSLTNNAVKLYTSFMNTQQLTDFQLATGQQTAAQVAARQAAGYTHDTRWYDVYYKENTPTYQVDLNISGGGGKTTYYISGGYFSQEGLAYRSGYKRFTMRSNLNTTVNSWFQMGLNLYAGYDDRQSNAYATNSLNGGLSLLAQPYYSPLDANGNDAYGQLMPGIGLYHPKYLADMITNPSNKLMLNPSAYIQLSPVKGVTIKSQAGIEFYDQRLTETRLPSYVGSLNNGSLVERFNRVSTKTITNTAEYQRRIANVHFVSVLAGQEFIGNNSTSFAGASTGQTDDRLFTISSGSSTTQTASSSRSEYSFLSYFGRLSYNYDSKYFLDLSARNDQSSRYGRELRGANFYSVGLMWNAKKEAFLDGATWVDDLKVKASYGTTGNSSGIGNYDALATVGTNNYNGNIGWAIGQPGNPQLSWETKRQLNLSVTGTLWKKLTFEAEYFTTMTDNMIISVPFPYTTGFTSINTNVGNLKNTGFNLDLNYNVFTKRNSSFNVYAKLGYVKQKVTELFQDRQFWIVPNTGISWAVGQPVTFLYPIFSQVNPTTGSPEWFKPNADPNLVTSTRKDEKDVSSTFNSTALQQNTGINRYAPFNGGFGASGSWKQFSIQADFSFSQGKYLINNDQYFFENPNQFSGYNQSVNVLDYWKNPGDVARYPKYGIQFTQFDSRLIQNASFMRLKSLQLSYDVAKSLLSKTSAITGARFYVMFRNIWTLTSYKGPDPEVDSNLGLGTNPNTRQVAFGLNLNF